VTTVWRTLGWIGWIVLALVSALGFYIFLVVSNA
jgi:hypothetical protein